MPTEYDAIIIGTGAGGGTLALQLAQAGKKILVLERGPFMPQEKLNWDTSAVFLDNRYHTKETWQDKDGKDLHPQQSYFVGGQTKVYGAAMFRMRAEDFGLIQHQGGISPAWPISYSDMEPYYSRAEELFHVHGDLGASPPVPGGFGSSYDPTEPFHSRKYPYPAFANEPRMQSIEDDVRKLGIHTFPIPLGLKRNEADPLASKCVRCDTCDGYPCLVHAKSDADINCIRQIMHLPNVTLMTNSRVTRLLTNSTGTAVTAVEVIHSGPGQALWFRRLAQLKPTHRPIEGRQRRNLHCRLFRRMRRRHQLRCDPPRISQRQISLDRPRQPLRSGWAQLHVPSGRRTSRHFYGSQRR
jgi:choline dehydrogenase-like flavoprotein